MKLILGGPGCGKTTALLNEVDMALERGVSPYKIGYVAFTRKAATEARERAQTKFGLTAEDLPHFRTLHSMAFAIGGFNSAEMMSAQDWNEYGEWMDVKLHIADETEEAFLTNQPELNAYSLARLKCRSLEDECYDNKLDYEKASYYAAHLKKFKDAKGKFDFTDLLETFIERNDCPQLDLLIVDEAQDLSLLQWKMVELLCENAKEVIIAGDDDQAIFEWAGADVPYFLRLEADRYVLPRSFRLPSSIHATVKSIASRITSRFDKNFSYNKEGGNVQRIAKLHHLDFSKGSWLLLARNRYMLSEPRAFLRDQGHPYIMDGKSSVDTVSCQALLAWEAMRKGKVIMGAQANLVMSKLLGSLYGTKQKFLPDEQINLASFKARTSLNGEPDWMQALVMPKSEREYYREIKKRGESLIAIPRITVATIHAVKGGEADSVVLQTDMSPTAYRSLIRNPSAESRVFYVGASRAKENLFILDPRTTQSYKVPA